MGVLASWLQAAGMAVGFACWLVCVISSIRMFRNLSPPGRQLMRTWRNRLGILMDDTNLTEQGLRHRRRYLWSLFGFLLCCAVVAVTDGLQKR